MGNPPSLSPPKACLPDSCLGESKEWSFDLRLSVTAAQETEKQRSRGCYLKGIKEYQIRATGGVVGRKNQLTGRKTTAGGGDGERDKDDN